MVANVLPGLWAAVLGPDRAPAAARPRLPAAVWPVFAATLAVTVFVDLGDVRLPAAPLLVRLGLAGAAALPVALVRHGPLLAWRIAALATLVTVPAEVAPDGLAWPWHPAQVAVLAGTVLAVALRHPAAVIAWVAAISGVAMLARAPEPDAVTAAVLVVVVAVLGAQVRRRVAARQSAEQARQNAEQTRRALLGERTRIARELHDVVGHHMSLIAVRAESAPYRLPRRPDAQEAEFTAIAGASRAALDDMRRLVGVLRGEEGVLRGEEGVLRGAEPDRPRLADVRALAGTAALAGLAVDLDADASAERAAAAPAAALAVYRIVQEALSNAAHHAPGGRVRIGLRLDGGDVRVAVDNTAAVRATGAPPRPGGGHGIAGMRERVAALGGTLTAGPGAGGGYRVEAVVPLHPCNAISPAAR
jgi:signal transduction histidine kinase